MGTSKLANRIAEDAWATVSSSVSAQDRHGEAMGATTTPAVESHFDNDHELLLDALHRTRQRADLLHLAVLELVQMQFGRGVDTASAWLALRSSGTTPALEVLIRGELLEPDHIETGEPWPMPASFLTDLPGEPSDTARLARLAGARRMFDGSDPLVDMRPEDRQR